MTAADVIAILEASQKNQVRVLKFADLEVELSPASPYGDGTLTGLTPHPAAEMAEPNHEKQAEVALERDELQMREDQIAEAILADPLLAEQLIRDGELVEEMNGSGDSGSIE